MLESIKFIIFLLIISFVVPAVADVEVEKKRLETCLETISETDPAFGPVNNLFIQGKTHYDQNRIDMAEYFFIQGIIYGTGLGVKKCKKIVKDEIGNTENIMRSRAYACFETKDLTMKNILKSSLDLGDGALYGYNKGALFENNKKFAETYYSNVLTFCK